MEKSIYNNKTITEIITDFGIVKKVIDRHYENETEAFKTDDIYSDEMVEFVANELADYDHDEESGMDNCDFEKYMELAEKIIDEIGGEIVDKINEYDRNETEGE